MSSKDNEEDLNPESLQTLQQWMPKYEKSCRKLMATYNSQETFSHYSEQSKRLCNTKSEYKVSPTDDLLDAFYQNHVLNALEIILREQMMEEKSTLSKEERNGILTNTKHILKNSRIPRKIMIVE